MEEAIGISVKDHYFCSPDAEAVIAKIREASPRYYDLELTIEHKPVYARGRPKADGRTLKEMHHAIKGALRQKPEAISTMREQAGCFALIANVPVEGPPNSNMPYDGRKILQAYKDQNGIEHNFSFLKDPVILNSVFLKRPERIEDLGLILVIALLIWRLIELNLRSHVEKQQSTFPGWDNKPTQRPTIFMMTTKFENIRIIKARHQRTVNGRLSVAQEKYLVALGLTCANFTQPSTFHASQ